MNEEKHLTETENYYELKRKIEIIHLIAQIAGIIAGIVLGSIATVNIGNITSYYSANNQEIQDNDTSVKGNNNTTTVNNNSNNTTDSHVENNNYYSQIIDENTSEETMLRYAEYAYGAGNFQDAVKIYSMNKLAMSTVALTNMGYFYAMGHYFQKNYDLADEYYDKAISLGSMKALENKIAMHLKNHKSDSLALLQKGHEANIKRVQEFLKNAFSKYYSNYSEYNYDRAVKWALYEAPEESKKDFLNSMYEWINEETVYLSFSPKDTDLIKYVKTGEFDWTNEKLGIVGTTNSYERWVLRCKGIELLEEGVEHINRLRIL